MLRISIALRSARDTTLYVEGRIVSDWVAVLEEECERVQRETPRIRLDLRAVTFIDRRGVAVIRALVARGVELVDCPEFVASLLTGGGGA